MYDCKECGGDLTGMGGPECTCGFENNIMVDLETMGNGGNSAIIAIGAVKFDKKVYGSFYEVVDLQSSVDAGLEMDPSTVLWWLGQSEEARAAFLPSEKGGDYPGILLVAALNLFFSWASSDAILWGNRQRLTTQSLIMLTGNAG